MLESSSRSVHLGATDTQRSEEFGSCSGGMQAKQPFLIKRLTLFIIHLHRSPTFFQIFMVCTQLIAIAQHILAPVSFLVSPHRENDAPRDLHHIYQICCAFCRLIPGTQTVIAHEITVLVTFIFSLMCLLLLLKTFFRLKMSQVISLNFQNIVTLLIIWFVRYLLPVSVSLFVNAVFSMIDEVAGLRMLMLSLMTLLIVTVVNFLVMAIIDCYPGFISAPGALWGYGKPLIKVSGILIFFALAEIIQHLDNMQAQLTLAALMLVLVIASMIFVLYYLPFTSIAYMEANVGVLVLVAAVLLVYMSSYRFNDSNAVLLTALSSILPSFVISGLFVNFAGSRAESLVLDSLSLEGAENLPIDTIKSPGRLMSVLCYCFRYQDDQFVLFEHALEHFPKDFDVAWIYAKIAAIHTDKPELITRLMTEMNRRAGNSIRNWIIVSLFGVLFTDDVDYGAKSIRSINACNKAVDDFFALLHLFWTEVHFGRSSRLSSLANEANIKYNKVRSMFSRLFVKHANEPAFKQSYQKFQSFVTVQMSRDLVKDFLFLPDIFLQDTIRLFNNVEQRKPLVDVNALESKTLFSPAAAMLQDMTRKRLSVLGHIVSWFPFYFGVFLGLLYASVLFTVHTKLQATWTLYFETRNLTEYVAATYMALPFRTLHKDGYLEQADLKYHIVDFEWIYLTNMTNIELDIATLCDDITNATIEFARGVSALGFEGADNPVTKTYKIKTETVDGVTEQPYTLIPMLLHFVVDIRNLLSNDAIPGEDIWNVTGTNRFDNFQTLIGGLLDVISYLHTKSHQRILNVETRTFNILTITIIVASIIFLLVTCICYVYLLRTHSELFEPFLLLPKTAISELLEELGDKMATDNNISDNLDAEQTFNFRQLSYPSPPSSYPTTKGLFWRYFAYSFIVILITCVFWYFMKQMALDEVNSVADTIRNSKVYVECPFYVYTSGYNIAMSILNGQYNFMDQDTYDEFIRDTTVTFHDAVALNMMNGSVYNYTVLNTSEFLNSKICDFESVTCIPRAYAMLSFITNIFVTLENRTDENNLKTVRSLLLTASSLSPRLAGTLEQNYMLYDHSIIFRYTGVVVGYFSLLLVMVVISQFYIERIAPPSYFSTAVLSSIPSCVFSDNEKVLDVIVPKSVDSQIGIDLLNRPSTREFLLDMVFLLGHDGRILSVTRNVSEKWDLNDFEMLNQDFREILLRVCPDFPDDIVLPPETFFTRKLKLNVKSTALTVIAHFVPATTFTFDGRQVAYAVVMQDVSYEEALIKKINQEANRLRLLMYCIVPKPVADSLLDTGAFTEFLVSKACIASFMIEGIEKIKFKDIITKLKDYIRSIVEAKEATMLGRSCQCFRIVCGLFDPDITVPQMASMITKFCLYFMHKLKQFKRQEDIEIDIFCTIHMSGPLLADVTKEPLPVFDLFGSQSNAYQIMSSAFAANKVCITRDMYDSMNYDDEFDLSFFTEIETVKGPPLELFIARKARRERNLQQSLDDLEPLIQFSAMGQDLSKSARSRNGSFLLSTVDGELNTSTSIDSESVTGSSTMARVNSEESAHSDSTSTELSVKQESETPEQKEQSEATQEKSASTESADEEESQPDKSEPTSVDEEESQTESGSSKTEETSVRSSTDGSDEKTESESEASSSEPASSSTEQSSS